MINNMSYEEILNITNNLKEQIEILKSMNISRISDFISTVEGYTKYLETTVKLNQDADNALKDITK